MFPSPGGYNDRKAMLVIRQSLDDVFFRSMNMSTDEMFSPFVQYSVGEEEDLPTVETVGCLVPGNDPNVWTLSQATEPIAATQSTDSAALRKAGQRTPAGQQYRLVGLSIFKPASHVGERVAARGVLIGGLQPRINVTSLQTVAGGACTR